MPAPHTVETANIVLDETFCANRRDCAPGRVLLVEDDPADAELVLRQLAREGHQRASEEALRRSQCRLGAHLADRVAMPFPPPQVPAP